MKHLDLSSYQALRKREPEAVIHFREHLKEGCDTCEGFLAERTELDGITDAMLTGHLPTGDADDAAFDQVVKGLHAPRRRRNALWGAAAVVLMIPWVVIVSRPLMQRPASESDGVKGLESLRLEVTPLVRNQEGEMSPLVPGSVVSSSDILFFRYETNRPLSILMVRKAGTSAPEVLGEFELDEGGHNHLGGQDVAAFTFENDRGVVSFWMLPIESLSRSRAESIREATERLPPNATVRVEEKR